MTLTIRERDVLAIVAEQQAISDRQLRDSLASRMPSDEVVLVLNALREKSLVTFIREARHMTIAITRSGRVLAEEHRRVG